MNKEKGKKQPSPTTKPVKEYEAILLNCDNHMFEVVMWQLEEILGCTETKAARLTYIANRFGRATVYHGTKNDCEEVATGLASIGLLTEIR